MPVKGLLVTLDNDQDKVASALSLLSDHEEIELGDPAEKYLPLVVETATESRSKQVYRWIESLDGVYFVDTVFSSVDGPDEDPTNFANATSKREN